MSDAAISATGLGKRYRIGRRPPGSLRDALTEGAAAWFERSKDRLAGRSADPRTVWALKDVSFEVQAGRGGRHHRPQRRRQEHAAEDPVAASPSPTEGRADAYGAVWARCWRSAPASTRS